jgi:hypothetical protein
MFHLQQAILIGSYAGDMPHTTVIQSMGWIWIGVFAAKEILPGSRGTGPVTPGYKGTSL